MTSSSLQQAIKRMLYEQPLTFLDPIFYTSPELASLEEQNIFGKAWLYVCHADKLSKPGSAMAVEVASRSLILMRSAQGELLAFHNACSHRGSALLPPTAEASVDVVKCLVCPYHGWTFNTQGILKGMPEKDRFCQSVDFGKLSLKPVRLETWGPLVFVSFSQSVLPLKQYLGAAVARMAGFPTESLTLLFEKNYEIACNWKTFHDNGLCDYHVSIAHKTTLKDVQGLTQHYQYEFDDYVNALITPITKSWQAKNEIWEVLPAPLCSQFITFGIFPNLHVYALPDGTLYVERIDPISVNTCQVHSEVYGLPHHLANVNKIKDWYDTLFEEDRLLAEGVQKGYVSLQGKSGEAKHTPGPINSLEARIVHQQQLIRRFLLSGLPRDLAAPIGSDYSEKFRQSGTFKAVMQRPI